MGKAIPFIALVDGKFNLTEEAAAFLSTIDYPVSVIAVVGLYRTGKSFLLNRILLDSSDGFQVGPTVNPCTKGLWLWDKVMDGVNKEGEKVKYLVVDTEGIGALDTNSQHDSTIFSLALLLSSYFIYNSVGSIDESALNNLSLVVNLTKHIHVRSSAQGGEDDGADFAQYFPSFLWLVRDFTLQLVTPDGQAFTSKEYLERALQPAPGFTEQIEAKNRIRRMLTHFFPDRDCFTMVRPVTDESLLQTLNVTPAEKLRPEFRDQMSALKKLIMSRAIPKKMNDTNLDGAALVNLAMAYTQSINTGSVPSIQNAWSYICESKCQQALNEALKRYEEEVKLLRAESLPLNADELDDINKELVSEVWETFKKHAIGTDTEPFKKQLEDKVLVVYRQLQADNQAMGREKAKEVLEKLYAPLDIKVQEEAFASFDEYEAERKKVRAAYMEEVPNSTAKLEVLCVFMEQKISESASRFQSRSSMEMQKTKAEAKAAVDDAQRELMTAKMESEKEMGSVKLKLEYAEKYNEEAKAREKESRDEITRMRTTHEAAIKEMREKAEAELKTQVTALEEKRSKAQQEAQAAEQSLLQLRKDQEKQTALLEQEKEFATKSAKDAQEREAHLTKLLESARRDAENDLKTMGDKLDSERNASSAKIAELSEGLEKASEGLAEWKRLHASLGVQLSEQIAQLQGELEGKSADLASALDKVAELEAEGGKKAKAENEVLTKEIEALRAQVEELSTEKKELRNAQTVAAEDQARLEQQLSDVRKQLRESEDRAKRLAAELDAEETKRRELEESDGTKTSDLEALKKQLSALRQEKESKEKELSASLATTSEKLDTVSSQSQAQIGELEKVKADLVVKLEAAEVSVSQLNDEVDSLRSELAKAEEESAKKGTATEDEWKQKLADVERKLSKKATENAAAAERTQVEMRHSFQTEKDVMEQRIRSLEKQLGDDKAEHDAEVAELNAAIDEMEEEHQKESEKKQRAAEKLLADTEKVYLAKQAQHEVHIEGQASKITMLEEQVADLKKTYKEDKAGLQEQQEATLKSLRLDSEQRISKLEGDVSAAMAKNEMLLGELAKSEETHSAKIEDLNTRHGQTVEKLERERKELQKERDEMHMQLSSESDALMVRVKQMENDAIMTKKDHETELALITRELKQLEKMLEEREATLRNLESSKESETADLKAKLASVRSDDEAKMSKEREESRKKFEELKTKSETQTRGLKEQLNAKMTELKVLEERIDGHKASEAKAASTIADYKTRIQDQKDQFTLQVKELKESLAGTQKELQEERSEHQMMKLRAEKQEEWDKREMAQLKEEVAEKKKTMDGMISKEIYKRDMDSHKTQHQNALSELIREKDSDKARLEGERKRLEEELSKAMNQLKKMTSEGVMSAEKQREMDKVRTDRERFSKELEEAKRELEQLRKSDKTRQEELKKREMELMASSERLKPLERDREDLKRERDELETKVMKLEMELKNIQGIEERKYQVEIMRLKTENEELRRADKKKQMIEPKTPSVGGDGAGAEQAPALTSALARVRARRTTAQGSAK